jgi:hypothetical protein
MCSKYINGYVKDNSLRNMEKGDIVNEIYRVRNSFGSKQLKHAGLKVYGIRPSI